jgi:hypothetical protein
MVTSNKITTSLVKYRLMRKDEDVARVQEFVRLKLIMHPKERENEFFLLHNVVLSNEKLYNMIHWDQCITKVLLSW